jgi:hypothetical protein
VARLGKALVEQFEGFDDDMCSAWMAHHVARLMVEAKEALPVDRPTAEDRCRTAILEIWRYRRSFNSPRPLESADQTLRAIRALRDQEGGWYFAASAKDGSPEEDRALQLARGVDAGARAILRYLFTLSFASKANEDQPWFEFVASPLFRDAEDLEGVRALIADAEALHGEGVEVDGSPSKIREDVERKLLALGGMARAISEQLGSTDKTSSEIPET